MGRVRIDVCGHGECLTAGRLFYDQILRYFLSTLARQLLRWYGENRLNPSIRFALTQSLDSYGYERG